MDKLIDEALSLWTEAGRLSDRFIRLAEGGGSPCPMLHRAFAGYLVELQDETAMLIISALEGTTDAGGTAGKLAALKREYSILARAYTQTTREAV